MRIKTVGERAMRPEIGYLFNTMKHDFLKKKVNKSKFVKVCQNIANN